MAVPSEYHVLNQDGSVNYKESLLNWIRSINDPVFEVQSDLSAFLKKWADFTVPLKTEIKGEVVVMLTEVRDKADAIITEINGL